MTHRVYDFRKQLVARELCMKSVSDLPDFCEELYGCLIRLVPLEMEHWGDANLTENDETFFIFVEKQKIVNTSHLNFITVNEVIM